MSTGAKCWGKLVPVLEYQVPNCTCFQMEWVLAHYAPAACILSSVVPIDFGSWENAGALSTILTNSNPVYRCTRVPHV